jgi:hypothetical protein
MITDPKTIPAGRVARIAFGAAVAVASTLLIAPQTTEFGAKVALLSGLVVLCAARWVFARFLPAPDSDQDRLRGMLPRLTGARSADVSPRRAFIVGAVAGSTIVLLWTAIVVAGSPARDPLQPARVSPAPAVEIDPSTLPGVTVDPDFAALSDELTGDGAQGLAVTLAENLEIEAEALRGADRTLLSAVDDGARLREMRGRIDDAVASGESTVARYRFDSLHLVPIVASGEQRGLSLGFEARGTVEEVTYNASGEETGRTSEPFAITFVMSRPTGDRWLIVETRPLP